MRQRDFLMAFREVTSAPNPGENTQLPVTRVRNGTSKPVSSSYEKPICRGNFPEGSSRHKISHLLRQNLAEYLAENIEIKAVVFESKYKMFQRQVARMIRANGVFLDGSVCALAADHLGTDKRLCKRGRIFKAYRSISHV